MLERRHHFLRRSHALLLTLFIPALAAAQTAAPAPSPANKSAANVCPAPAADAGRFAGVFVALYPQKVITADGQEDTKARDANDARLNKLVVDAQSTNELDPFQLKGLKTELPGEWRVNRGISLINFVELTKPLKQTCDESQSCLQKKTEGCKKRLTQANSSILGPKISAEEISSKCQEQLKPNCECQESRQVILARRACKESVKGSELEAADKYFLLVSAVIPLHDIPLHPDEPAVHVLREIFQCKKGEPEIVSQPLLLPNKCVYDLKILPSKSLVPDDLKKIISLAVAEAKKDIPPPATPVVANPNPPGKEGTGTLPPVTAGTLRPGNPSSQPVCEVCKPPPQTSTGTTDATANKNDQPRTPALKFSLAYIGSSVVATGVTFAILGGLNWSGFTNQSFGTGCGPMQDMSCVDVRHQLNSGVAVAGIAHAASIIGLGITLGLEGHRTDKTKSKPALAVTPAAEKHDDQAQ